MIFSEKSKLQNHMLQYFKILKKTLKREFQNTKPKIEQIAAVTLIHMTVTPDQFLCIKIRPL